VADGVIGLDRQLRSESMIPKRRMQAICV